MKKFRDYLNENYSTIDGNVASDTELLRTAIQLEYKASNDYALMAKQATNYEVQLVLDKVSKEEITHYGEFEALLKKYDPEHEPAEEKGEDEVKAMGIKLPESVEEINEKVTRKDFEYEAIEGVPNTYAVYYYSGDRGRVVIGWVGWKDTGWTCRPKKDSGKANYNKDSGKWKSKRCDTRLKATKNLLKSKIE